MVGTFALAGGPSGEQAGSSESLVTRVLGGGWLVQI